MEISRALWLVLPLLFAACGDARKSNVFAQAVNAERRYDAAQLQRGAALYRQYCARCHGDKGQGKVLPWNVRQADGFYPPPPLDDSAHAWHHPTTVLVRVVREGSPPGQGKMPGWKDRLGEAEIVDVVVYVTSLWSDEKYQLWFAQIETPAREQGAAR
jgi:mono/diheme cytochrome c family protein